MSLWAYLLRLYFLLLPLLGGCGPAAWRLSVTVAYDVPVGPQPSAQPLEVPAQ